MAAEGPSCGIEPVFRRLVELSRESQRARSQEHGRPLRAAEIELGTWFCIGPFKDARYGLFSRSFQKPLGPEEDVIARGDRPTFLKFAMEGKSLGWDAAVQKHYRLSSLADLQTAWQAWAEQTSRAAAAVSLSARPAATVEHALGR